ncbi:MAG: hypothetical protein A4E66_01862 [Syntrophus sp. PtaB.Bin001]|nr:MAG: hypothetical protein A4E66_01862 [Syntrophus sp. PtaB.Bin001]
MTYSENLFEVVIMIEKVDSDIFLTLRLEDGLMNALSIKTKEGSDGYK